MYKFLLSISVCFCLGNLKAQDIILDTLSVNNGYIIEDTISVYIIDSIEVFDDEYIIHATRDEFHFRIKSKKVLSSKTNECSLLKVGNSYQLDIRDYRNPKTRILYSTKYKGMGFCEPLGNGEGLCEHNPMQPNTFSQVLNLKGLCISDD